MEEIVRKSSQEVEIDHLLAEEFFCDRAFAGRFLSACRPAVDCREFRVTAVFPEPSLAGNGYGDLLVEGEVDGLRVALLIEDKITAGPGIRQADRYLAHADRLRAAGWQRVWCVLVAPRGYIGEREKYDASIDLERVSELMHATDPIRLEWRCNVILRSIQKKIVSGVKIPDHDLHRMKAEYLAFVSAWCTAEGVELAFPVLRDSYYDGDSWVEPIRHARLPKHVKLRHRWWTSVKESSGQVDLIASPADEKERARFRDKCPNGFLSSPFSKGKGEQISARVSEMRQGSGFDPDAASEACRVMNELVQWYLDGVPEK